MARPAVAFLFVLALASPASADPVEGDDWARSLSVGIGLVTFTEPGMRDVTEPAGALTVRAVVRTRSAFALEAGFAWSTHLLRGPGMDDARLRAASLEAGVRLNLVPGPWQPYLVTGVGWKHYGLYDYLGRTGVRDDVLEMPVGAGVTFLTRGVAVDLRAVYRLAVGSDLVLTDDGPPEDMSNLTVGASVGIEL
jgi:hypothetical protein